MRGLPRLSGGRARPRVAQFDVSRLHSCFGASAVICEKKRCVLFFRSEPWRSSRRSRLGWRAPTTRPLRWSRIPPSPSCLRKGTPPRVRRVQRCPGPRFHRRPADREVRLFFRDVPDLGRRTRGGVLTLRVSGRACGRMHFPARGARLPWLLRGLEGEGCTIAPRASGVPLGAHVLRARTLDEPGRRDDERAPPGGGPDASPRLGRLSHSRRPCRAPGRGSARELAHRRSPSFVGRRLGDDRIGARRCGHPRHVALAPLDRHSRAVDRVAEVASIFRGPTRTTVTPERRVRPLRPLRPKRGTQPVK
jgi:hypothetical protein